MVDYKGLSISKSHDTMTTSTAAQAEHSEHNGVHRHRAQCRLWPAICSIRGHRGMSPSWVTASHPPLNICHALGARHLHQPHAWPAPPRCHILTSSIIWNRPLLSPPRPGAHRTKHPFWLPLHNRSVSPRENLLLQSQRTPPPPPVLLLPISPPSVLVVINFLCPPPTLLLPPTLSVSQSGLPFYSKPLCSSTPSSHRNNLLLTGPEYADWLIQLQLLSRKCICSTFQRLSSE